MARDPYQLALARRFAAALASLDRRQLRDVCTEDVRWTTPGDNPVSGERHGIDAVVDMGRALREREIEMDLQKILHGRDSMVVLLRESGGQRGRRLDVDVALVLEVRDGKVASVTGHIDDVVMFSDYLR